MCPFLSIHLLNRTLVLPLPFLCGPSTWRILNGKFQIVRLTEFHVKRWMTQAETNC